LLPINTDLVKPPRRANGTLSRHVRMKGAAPLSGPEEQTARAISAYAQYAWLLLCKWEYKLD
jgi:hypothetical protein